MLLFNNVLSFLTLALTLTLTLTTTLILTVIPTLTAILKPFPRLCCSLNFAVLQAMLYHVSAVSLVSWSLNFDSKADDDHELC